MRLMRPSSRLSSGLVLALVAACATHEVPADLDEPVEEVEVRIVRTGDRWCRTETRGSTTSVTCGWYLQSHYFEAQAPDGSWDPRQVPRAGHQQIGSPHDRLWVTALCTLAIDGDSVTGDPMSAEDYERGPSWIVSLQRPNGALVDGPAGCEIDVLDHSVATLALVHHVQRFPDTPHREAAARAAHFLARAARAEGGWSRIAFVDDPLDTRTTAWAAISLHYAADHNFAEDQEQVALAVPALRRYVAEGRATRTSELHRLLVESLAGECELQQLPEPDEFLPFASEASGLTGREVHDPELLFLFTLASIHHPAAPKSSWSGVKASIDRAGLLDMGDEYHLWVGDRRARGGALGAYGLNLLSLHLYFKSGLNCRHDRRW